jgi:hypothetical protein
MLTSSIFSNKKEGAKFRRRRRENQEFRKPTFSATFFCLNESI